MIRKILLGIMILLAASGCAVREPMTDYSEYFQTESGNYLAFPLGEVSDYLAMSFSDRYKAVVRNSLDDDVPMDPEGNIIEALMAPARYKKLVAGDVEAILKSGQPWTILVMSQNHDFMTEVLKTIPDVPDSGLAAIEFIEDPGQEMLVQADRLHLIR